MRWTPNYMHAARPIEEGRVGARSPHEEAPVVWSNSQQNNASYAPNRVQGLDLGTLVAAMQLTTVEDSAFHSAGQARNSCLAETLQHTRRFNFSQIRSFLLPTVRSRTN